MKNLINILFFLLIPFCLLAQNGSLIIEDNANIVMVGNINLITLQSSNQGIQKTGNLQGGIICDNEQSRVIWGISTSTGNYVVPFKISNTLIPFSMNISGAGVGAGKVLLSTYHTAIDNTPYANGNGYFSSVTNVDLDGVDNSVNVVDRFWMINYTDYTSIPTSQFTMTYDAANDLNGIIENDLQAQYWNGVTWILPPSGVANPPSDNVNSIPSISQNAPWVLVNKLNPLPIELISFNVECDGNKRIGYFETSSEQNVDYYIIQSSINSTIWYDIGSINSYHNTNTIKKYNWNDTNYYSSTNIYYRLKEIDYDGFVSYYGLYSSVCTQNDKCFDICPNPAPSCDDVILSFHNFDEPVLVVLNDIYGNEIFTKIVITHQNGFVMGLDCMNKISSGTYIIVATSKNEIYKKKLIIQ